MNITNNSKKMSLLNYILHVCIYSTLKLATLSIRQIFEKAFFKLQNEGTALRIEIYVKVHSF